MLHREAIPEGLNAPVGKADLQGDLVVDKVLSVCVFSVHGRYSGEG